MKMKFMFFAVLLVFICCIGAVSASEDVTNDTLSSDSVEVIEQVNDMSQDLQTAESQDSMEEVDDEPLSSDENAILADDSSKPSKISVNASSWDELKTYAEKTDGDYIINLVEGKKITIGSSDIQFRNNAEIIGNANCFITGTANNRIPFKSTANTDLSITFKNIIFRNIKCQMVMQLQTKGISIVENCTFKGITAGTGHHSVIYNNLGLMNITGCTFTDSSAGFGVITNHNTASTTNIIMNVRDCYFANNYGDTEPGCINNCGILTVYNSTFEKNRAFWWAGAIHTHSNANTKIYGSSFIDNVAGWNGGALYTYSYLEIQDSVFLGNNCTTNSGGGAIGASAYGSNPNILINNCLFKDNTNVNSGGAGGAIATMDKGEFRLYNTTFINNNAAHGTAVSAAAAEGYGSPTLVIAGNTFINHTRSEDVLRVIVSGTGALVENNTFINNGIPASELYLNVSDPVDKKVNVSIIYSLKNPGYYDADILDKCTYDVYIDGKYSRTVNTTTFTLNFEDIDKCRVYVVPSIYSGQTPEVTITVPRDFIYVSQANGNDDNDGMTDATPVKTIEQALKLAKPCENIILLDGVFNEENLNVTYRLTIWGTNLSSIGGQTLTDSMFNVKNAKFSLRNLTINNINGADASRLIKGESSRVYLDNCIVKDNAINTLIESPVLGITDSVFENNKLSIQSSNLTVENSTFSKNTVNNDAAFFNSASANEWNIVDSTFIDNYGLKAGLISYSSQSSTLKIENSLFENNSGAQASAIIISDSAKLNIISSIIKDNDANVAVIYKNGAGSAIDIKNSIILNAGEIIAGDNSNIDCNYNWWGNTLENKDARPNLNPQISLDNWLFLNMEYSKESEIDVNYTIKLDLTSVIDKEGSISTYADYKLPVIGFTISANNVTADKDFAILDNGKSEINYTLNDFNDGSLTFAYENIKSTANFQFVKTTPEMNIVADAIMVGDDGSVEITFPEDLTGNVAIKIGDITKAEEIKDSSVKFTLEGLSAGNYTLTVSYDGDKKYASREENITYTVNKYESKTTIIVGEVVVSENVLVTVKVNDDATGNITIIVNGKETNLNVNNGQATYTIENISRGDWIIEATYNGDDKYATSHDYNKFGVDKYTAGVTIVLEDIEYGQDAYLDLSIDEEATGNVTVMVDNISITKTIVNGKVNFTLSNLTAGYKNVVVKYSGDNYYMEDTYSSTFYVEKIPTQVNISANDAKEGRNVIVNLAVPQGVEGTFTITIDDEEEYVIEIPSDGKAVWSTSDLEVGEHSIHVTYSGNNYMTCKNSTDIVISAWDEPQWPNQGYDNTGKTPYDSNVNGEVNWTASTDANISANIVIDNEGNIYIITENGIYSFDNTGKARWNYSSQTVFSGLTVGREVIIAPLSGDRLYFINQTSGEKYGVTNLWKASSQFAPIIDDDANVYVISDKNEETGHYNLVIVPYSLWEEGYDVDTIDLGTSAPTTAPVLVTDDIVCVGTADGLKLVSISEESVIAVVNVITNARPVVGESDIIYAIANNQIFAIDANGAELWKSSSKIENARYLAIDNENNILYAVDSNNNLYKYDLLNEGNETFISGNITSEILISDEGNIFAGSQTALIALDNTGKLLWKSEIGKTIDGSIVMDENGVIYVTGNNNLYAFAGNSLIDANLSMPSDNVQYGSDAKLIITLASDATGDIIVSINGTNYTGDIKNGVLEIPIANWAIGNYTAKITYSGDKRYSQSELIKQFNVTKAETKADDLNVSSGIYGSNPTFSINLPSDATGNLTVSVDGTNYTQELKNGSASVSIPKLATGTHNIVVSYTGDKNYNSISNAQNVTIYPVKITDNKDLVMDYNSGSAYRVCVWGNDGKVVEGAIVTFEINKKSYNIKTDKNGYAVLKINEIPKKYTITAKYEGVTVKNTVTVKQILKAKNFKVKKSAKKLVLKATLKNSNGKAIKGKVIKFKFKGKTYKAKTNKKGVAKVTIKKKVIKKLKAKKKYALKITYLKDTIKKTVRVKK